MSEILDCAAFLMIWHEKNLADALYECRGLRGARNIWSVATNWSKRKSVSFPRLLVRLSRIAKSSDARDKVFGSLGLHDSSQHSEIVAKFIKPDYSKSVGEVLRDAMRYSILDLIARNEVDKLYLLNSVEHESEVDLDGEFPSWVPRFDRPVVMEGSDVSISWDKQLQVDKSQMRQTLLALL